MRLLLSARVSGRGRRCSGGVFGREDLPQKIVNGGNVGVSVTQETMKPEKFKREGLIILSYKAYPIHINVSSTLTGGVPILYSITPECEATTSEMRPPNASLM